jgi:amino acid transporter
MSKTSPPSGSAPEVFIRRSSGLTRQVSAWDALMFCCLGPGLTLPFIYAMWTPWLFPGSHYAWANLFALLMLPVIALYFLFSIAMPRSGGEYIYVTRTLTPVLGLITSFIVAIVMVTSVAVPTDWGITYGLADGFLGAGIQNSWATSIGEALWSPGWRFILGTISIAFGAFLWMLGTKWIMRLSWTVVGITGIVTVLAAIVILGGGGTQGFINSWNALSGTNYNDILALAANKGFVVNFTVFGTVAAGFSYVALNTIGSTFSANIAGEIRGVQRSQLIALFGSVAVLIVFWIILSIEIYGSIGGEFMNAMSTLAHGAPDAYPAIMGGHEPFITIMFGFLTNNAVFLIFFGFLMYITIWTAGTALGFAVIRNIFAWSFDRIIPAKFAELDRRFKSPWLTIVVFWAVAELILVAQVFFPQAMFWSSVNIMAWFIAWTLVGVAGILFPYRRKQLFESAPGIVKARLGGIPVVTILGVLSVAVSLFVEYIMFQPFFAGTNDPKLLIWVALWVIIPIIIYYVSKAVRARSAVPLGMQFQELPPE